MKTNETDIQGVGTQGADTPATVAPAAAPDIPLAGLGVDLIEIERMERALARTPRLRERIFSEGERVYADAKARPVVHYALFFAAKEAVLKALGCGFAGVGFTDVEVGHDRAGRPLSLLHGRALTLAKEQGIVEMQLSLSYTHQVGVASAVAIREQDRPRRDEKADPREELARQFKELRVLLDDLEERVEKSDNAPASPVEDDDDDAPASPVEDDDDVPASNPS
ncbi:MAG: holo-ACP synthase [Coriobacteriales bacterium]|nr:holo-ACP synthase [Coriobacteriales bacterium]